MTVSKLQLVDLAGSEKSNLTGTTGQHAKEAIDINKSLHVLRKVITTLTESQAGKTAANQSFVPYRESKLTCLLKQSLGGNSYTLMVSHFISRSSLTFALTFRLHVSHHQTDISKRTWARLIMPHRPHKYQTLPPRTSTPNLPLWMTRSERSST